MRRWQKTGTQLHCSVESWVSTSEHLSLRDFDVVLRRFSSQQTCQLEACFVLHSARYLLLNVICSQLLLWLSISCLYTVSWLRWGQKFESISVHHNLRKTYHFGPTQCVNVHCLLNIRVTSGIIYVVWGSAKPKKWEGENSLISFCALHRGLCFWLIRGHSWMWPTDHPGDCWIDSDAVKQAVIQCWQFWLIPEEEQTCCTVKAW